MSKKNPSTVIAWEGSSQINGEPVVLLLTNLERPSANTKTGNMVQAVVLPQSQKPTDAVKNGSDESVCGNCPLRKTVCYVNLVPWNKVHTVYMSGNVPHVTTAVLERARTRNLRLRMTAYGDPAAVPLYVWKALLKFFPQYTGYTHQWRNLSPEWSHIFMASCENVAGVVAARAAGWSTFHVRSEDSPLLEWYDEIECPNVTNPDVQCSRCRLCNGNSDRQRSISVPVHGLDWKINNFAEVSR